MYGYMQAHTLWSIIIINVGYDTTRMLWMLQGKYRKGYDDKVTSPFRNSMSYDNCKHVYVCYNALQHNSNVFCMSG